MNTAGSSHISVTNPDFENVISKFLEDNDDSVYDNSDFIESVHDSESDQNADVTIESDDVESDSSDNEESIRTSKYFYGKNKYKWSADEFVSKCTRTARYNIITQISGLRGPVKNLGNTANPSDIWNTFYTDSIISEILNWTNVKIDSLREKYKQMSSFTKNVDEIELRSLLDYYFTLLFLSQTMKAQNFYLLLMGLVA